MDHNANEIKLLLILLLFFICSCGIPFDNGALLVSSFCSFCLVAACRANAMTGEIEDDVSVVSTDGGGVSSWDVAAV